MRVLLGFLLLADVGEPWKGVDLLRAVDPVRDALRGSWRFDGPVLVMQERSRLQIPYVPPVEYDLVLEVERATNTGKLLVGLASPPHAFDVVIDNWDSNEHRAGLHHLDGRHVTEYPARIGAVFANGRTHRIVYAVRRGSILVKVDGREIVRFEGDFKRLSVDPRYAPPDPRTLFIANELSRYLLRRITLRPLSSHGTPLGDPGRCPLPFDQSRWRCNVCSSVNVAGGPIAPRCCDVPMQRP